MQKKQHFMQATSPGREKRNRKLTSCEGQHPAFLHQLPAEKVTGTTRNSVSNKESQIRKTINCVALPPPLCYHTVVEKQKRKTSFNQNGAAKNKEITISLCK